MLIRSLRLYRRIVCWTALAWIVALLCPGGGLSQPRTIDYFLFYVRVICGVVALGALGVILVIICTYWRSQEWRCRSVLYTVILNVALAVAASLLRFSP